MGEYCIRLEKAYSHELADELHRSDLDSPFMDTQWNGNYELLIIKCGADNAGFCVVALNGLPEVAKFFICPKFRMANLSVTAALQVFSYIESQYGADYSLQVLSQGPFVDRAWRFWVKAVAGRTAVQSGSNILIGNWE